MELTTIVYALCTVVIALAGVIVKLAVAYDKLRKEKDKSNAERDERLEKYRKEWQEVQDERIRDLKESRNVMESPRELVSVVVEAIKKANG